MNTHKHNAHVQPIQSIARQFEKQLVNSKRSLKALDIFVWCG